MRLISPLGSLGAGDAVRVASGVLIGIAAFYVFDTRDRLLQLSRAAFLGGVAVAGMTVVQYAITKVSPGAAHAIFGRNAFVYSADQSHSNHVARVAGSLGAPGETSGFLVVTASFGLLRYALLRDTARTRGIAAGIALMGLAIVATLTRASTVAFLLLILIWMVQRQFRFVSAVGLRMKILVALLVCVVLAVPVLGSQTLHTRLWDINPTSSGTGFAQGRGAIWSTEIRRMEASNVPQLLLGHGAHTAELQGYANGSPTETSPHNLFVWLLIETGFIGTVLYIAFLIGAGLRYRAAARWRRFEYAGQVGAVALAALDRLSGARDVLAIAHQPGSWDLLHALHRRHSESMYCGSEHVAGRKHRVRLAVWSRVGRDSAVFAGAAMLMALFQAAFRLLAIHDLSIESYGRAALLLSVFNFALVFANFGIPAAAARLAARSTGLTRGRDVLTSVTKAAVIPSIAAGLALGLTTLALTNSIGLALVCAAGVFPMVMSSVYAGFIRGRGFVWSSASVQPVNVVVQLLVLAAISAAGVPVGVGECFSASASGTSPHSCSPSRTSSGGGGRCTSRIVPRTHKSRRGVCLPSQLGCRSRMPP